MTWWDKHGDKMLGALGAGISALYFTSPTVLISVFGPKSPGIIFLMYSVVISINGFLGNGKPILPSLPSPNDASTSPKRNQS